MDFFAQQEAARAASRRLIGWYALAVGAIVVTIHVAVTGLLTVAAAEHRVPGRFVERLRDPALFVRTGGLALAVVVLGTLVKIVALRGGGPRVAASLGGREVAPNTRDFAERRLLNVVEEMALAAGVRVPRVYVLDGEDGINAFAAGYTPDDAAVAVTAGLLRTLNRAELQAVVGHEFSHILNGDMRLNIRLIGVLGGILGIAVVGRVVMELALRSLRFSAPRRASNRKNDGAGGALLFALLGLALFTIGSIGVLFGRLIQAAISRQREYLADAAAVQFTRAPESLANALKLIGAHARHATLRNGHATEIAHMLFAGGVTNLFATHPPLVTRIRRLDPTFAGDFTAVQAQLARRGAGADGASGRDGGRNADETVEKGRFAGLAAGIDAARQATDAGTPASDAAPPTALARLTWLGDEEREALRDPAAAECCLYAAVLSADAAVRARQQAAIRARNPHAAEDFVRTVAAWSDRHASRTARQRRMVCELAAETLRPSEGARRAAIVALLQELSVADGHLDSFEFALGHMARRRLADDSARASARCRIHAPATLAREAGLVLSAFARFGARTPEAAAAAWHAGVARLSLFGPLERIAAAEPDPHAFEAALARLAHLPPLAKREFMAAGETLVVHDGTVTDIEENFLVAIADAIDAVGWRFDPNLAAPPSPRALR